MFKKIALSILFIVSLLRSTPVNIIQFLSERYDRHHVKIFQLQTHSLNINKYYTFNRAEISLYYRKEELSLFSEVKNEIT